MGLLKKILLCAAALWMLPAPAAERGDTAVSFVICDAGHDVYELEGHAALHVTLPDGHDAAVHWGLFNFDAPGFVWRFALGETDYLCGATPWDRFLESYRRQGRRVTEYPLLLDSAEKQRLLALLHENLLPWNATYRYNYVKDNCSTRPLRMVEEAIGDTLALGRPTGHAGDTFRGMMRAYHRNYPWYQFGIDLALGSGIDYRLTDREKAFSPIALEVQLAKATRTDGRPIAGEAVVAVAAPAGAAVAGATPWWATPMAAAILVLAAAVAVTVRDRRRRRVCRVFDTALYGVLGAAGCLVFFLTVFSSHEATSPNFLLAWVNPLCLVPVIFIWIKKAQRLVLCYQIANFAVIFAMCAAWPLLPQSANIAFWPLIAADALRAANYITITASAAKHTLNKTT